MADAAPGVIKVTDWYALRRVMFYDPAYRSSWVHNSAELARYFSDKGGYVPLSAFQLREWMKVQVAEGAEGSVCFFTQDVAPDQVAESEDAWDQSMASQNIVSRKRDKPSQSCLLMAYLRAGGRVVWVGDVPFYYLGRRGGEVDNWGLAGQKKVLGLDSFWDLKAEAVLTEAGREWGLTATETAARCVPAADVTAVLTQAGDYAVSFFKNFKPEIPQSGFLRLGALMPPQDLLRAAQHGVEEEEAIPSEEEPVNPHAFAADKAVLVSSGTFVVDRQRALDKLMRFQLPDPETCLLPMVRCALAGKAPAVSIDELPEGGLELRFGGEPLTKKRLEDPYSALFEARSAANSAARHLATGLLCALRLKPQVITISAGATGARFRLRIDELGREQVQPSEDPGTGTVLRILWRGAFAGSRNEKLLNRVRLRCAMSPVPVMINRLDLDRGRGETSMPGIHFKEGALNGFICVPEWPVLTSTLSAAVNNVMVDTTMSVKLPYLQVSGYVNNDDFTLNISQSGVVNNSRRAKAMETVGRQLPKLLAHAQSRQGGVFGSAGVFLAYDGMRDYWSKCLEGEPQLEAGLMGLLLKGVKRLLEAGGGEEAAKREKVERQLRETAWITRWIREACARLLKDYKQDSADQMLKALWEAPVFLSINSAPLSMKDVWTQQKELGFVPYSRKQYPGLTLPFNVLWCPGDKDLELISRWSTADLTVKIPHYGVNPAVAEEFMGGGGLRLLAARHNLYIAPAVRGSGLDKRGVEISLPDLPPPPAEPVKAPAPQPPVPASPPPPAPPRAAEPPRKAPAPPAPRKPAPPLPTEQQLVQNPAAHFPEYLYRRAFAIQATGSRLVAKFIKERAADAKWMTRAPASDVLESGLPPLRKAEYLLSVFYTDYNRREATLTDKDDMDFQQALAESIQEGEQ